MNTEDIIKSWYSVTAYGAATLCVSEQDARDVSATSDKQWPQNGPHRAVQLVDAYALAALEARASASDEARRAAQVEAAELKERILKEGLKTNLEASKRIKAEKERDALRARLAEFEAQEPVLYVQSDHVSHARFAPFFARMCAHPMDGIHSVPFYARPVPAASVPDGAPAAYFSYGSDAGYAEHSTQHEARAAARDDLSAYRDDAMRDNEWPEEVESVCWGMVLQKTTAVDNSEEAGQPSFEYELAPEQPIISGADVARDAWPDCLEAEQDYLLSELAGVDTWDMNLRDHPKALQAVDRYTEKVREMLAQRAVLALDQKRRGG